MRHFYHLILILSLALLCRACGNRQTEITPKPQAYFRLDLPEHEYDRIDTTLPFIFDKSTHAQITLTPQSNGACWVDIDYPKENASFKFTYMPIACADSLRELIYREEKMVKFHYQKADDVEYDIIQDPESRLWGQIYHIEGKEVATPMQFWITDSCHHFLRGTLYFNFAPNNDSLEPVIQYLSEDAMRIIKSFEWK